MDFYGSIHFSGRTKQKRAITGWTAIPCPLLSTPISPRVTPLGVALHLETSYWRVLTPLSLRLSFIDPSATSIHCFSKYILLQSKNSREES